MNCKQGDLAVIVRSCCGNEGRIVTCVALDVAGASVGPNWDVRPGAAWWTEPPILGWNGTVVPVRDALLRPIRDSDEEDEMLRLVGRPVGTPQAA
ncbi:MAG: hypothetical protein ACOVOX_03685 [Burkholderiaceae bacterium]